MSGHRWTPDEMRSLTGTTAVVTGANSGIGWYTALELARHAASVTLAVRTPAKGEAAAAPTSGSARWTSGRWTRSGPSPRTGRARSACWSTTPD